jgi:transcriptional regulator with XRE-family HTH domain
MITPAQCRAARALLDFPQARLATLAEVSEATIRSFESGQRKTATNNLKAICSALETAGIEFVDTHGVALRRSDSGPIKHRSTITSPGVIEAKKAANDSRLEDIARRVALSQINPNLKYEVHGNRLILTMILGSAHIAPGSGDLSRVEFQPPLESKRDRDDHRLTTFELIRFAEQCYRGLPNGE